jgi:serine/threonine-protein kinase
MGIVFEAEDMAHDRLVALKVLRPHLSRDATYLVRFVEEIRVLSSLKHDAIVEVYGRGREGNLVYLTMELVDGPSARDAIRNHGHLPWREVARITWSAARALNAAHQQAGVVHGDVKPGNFLLTKGGRIKLCDFGLARVDLKERPSKDRAQENERRGTAAYAAPERFLDQPATVSSDIYSLGVSMFQMATGELPYLEASVAALRIAHMDRAVPLLRSRIDGINPAMQMLLERMMAKSDQDRFENYPSLISDLSLLVEG